MSRKQYESNQVVLEKGEEMGRFNMGSTVVLLMESSEPALSEALVEGLTLRMGQAISL